MMRVSQNNQADIQSPKDDRLTFSKEWTTIADMITEREKMIIRTISERYNPKKVLLFGSALLADKPSRDIDVAVEGIEEKDFFSFYADLIFALDKPVDVVDLKNDTKFNRLVRRTGTVIYG